jgi:predicted negative regulator of RcsB-dependent stress response
METGTPESAMKWLDAPFPPEFEALATDRRGDVLLAQGKKDDARAAFLKARQLMTDREQYRQLVDVKLAALGVDATSSTASPPAAAPAK